MVCSQCEELGGAAVVRDSVPACFMAGVPVLSNLQLSALCISSRSMMWRETAAVKIVAVRHRPASPVRAAMCGPNS